MYCLLVFCSGVASQYVGDKVVDEIYKHGSDGMKVFVRREDVPSVAVSISVILDKSIISMTTCTDKMIALNIQVKLMIK